MISVSQADTLITELVEPRLDAVPLPLSQCVGRVLQEPIYADRDYPPFDRICMDGIAVHSSHLSEGRWPKQGLQKAGDEALSLNSLDQCIEVMTGTLTPLGADTCIRYEDLQDEGEFFRLVPEAKVKPLQNIHPTGTDYKSGELLVDEGVMINSTHIAIAASVGLSELKVYRDPKITLLSTGDEVVPYHTTPLAHQIRRSNAPAIAAALQQFGFRNVCDEHLNDEASVLEAGIQKALRNSDILILMGGVSAGKFDLVPQCLKACGVRETFHRVQFRPGKPLWVGVGPGGQIIFGLPGNPVSAMVCFRRFLLPLLQLKSGLKQLKPTCVVLASEVEFTPNLTWFLPVQLKSLSSGQLEATPKPTRGSGDFSTLGHTDGFIELPADQSVFAKGSVFKFYSWT